MAVLVLMAVLLGSTTGFATSSGDLSAEARILFEEVRQKTTGDFLILLQVAGIESYRWREESIMRLFDKQGDVESVVLRQVVEVTHPSGRTLRRIVESQPETLRGVKSEAGGCRRWPTEPDPKLASRIWSVMDLTFLEKKLLEGRETWVFSFRTPDRGLPKGFKSHQALKGRLWIDDLDRRLVGAESQYYKDVVLSWGFFVSSGQSKGVGWKWRVIRTLQGDWLPFRWETYGPPMKSFLSRKKRRHQGICQYSEHQGMS